MVSFPASVAQARDALTKARVTIHSFQTANVETDVQAGLKVAARTLPAGNDALAERDFRRIGLGISLLAIAAVVIGLWFCIRELASADRSGNPGNRLLGSSSKSEEKEF